MSVGSGVMDEIREAWERWGLSVGAVYTLDAEDDMFERDCLRWLLAEARWYAEGWRDGPYPFPWEPADKFEEAR